MVKAVKYGSTGRRKSSIARVNIVPGTGKIRINKRPFENYFPSATDQIMILEPIKVTNSVGKFDVDVKVTGGGTTGQVGAMRLGLERVLAICDPENRAVLKKNDLLRRDPRMKERQKPGQKGARKKFQWVKR